MFAEYLQAAMRRAVYEQLEDDKSYFGSIPGFQGVWGNAPTLEACRELAEQSGVRLEGQVKGDLGAVWLDPRQMYRVLSNLTLNALRYTPRDGMILLLARRQMGQDGVDQVLVQVIDSGVGVATGDLPHIFERSFRGEGSRRREQEAWESAPRGSLSSGSGLGLAIAREIVEMHGGRIWAISPLPPDLTALVPCAPQSALSQEDESAGGTAIIWTLPM